MAAEKATPEAINFMAKYGRGLICLPMSAERIDRLGLNMMVGDNQAPLGTAFTTSITARRASGRESRRRTARPPFCRRCARTPRRRVHHARLRLSAARARRRRAGAHRPDRGRGRPGAAGGAQAGGRHLRDSERRRHDGAARRPGRFRQAAQPQDRHRRRHHRIPAAQRDDGPAHRRGEAADRIRRVHRDRVSQPGRFHRTSGAGDGQGRSAADPGARASRVPARRRFRLFAAQHAQPAARRDGANRGGGRGRAALSQARGERHRGRSRRRASGTPRDHAGQPARRGFSRLRNRRADLARRRRAQNDRAVGYAAAAGESSRLWTGDRRIVPLSTNGKQAPPPSRCILLRNRGVARRF